MIGNVSAPAWGAALVATVLATAPGCLPRATTEAANLDSSDEAVRVEFRVSVPKETPADARVCLTGNLPLLGMWKADGLPLKRNDDGTYRAIAVLPAGKVLSYKVTLGSWRQVETGPNGEEVQNRSLALNVGQEVTIQVASWSDGRRPSLAPTRHGDIRSHADFASEVLGNRRAIDVYVPPGYDAHPEARYPVLYMHDGQNVFDAATSAFGMEWRADETAERLIRDGAIRPILIVAIGSTPARIDEYTAHADGRRRIGGKGDQYARFVMEELKPFIDATYRTKPGRADTAVVGSSLGGLISLRIAERYADRVSMCGVLSPTLWWADEQVLNDLDSPGGADWLTRGTRFWLDMGTSEGARPRESSPELPRTRRLAARFAAAGLKPDRDFICKEIAHGEHDETTWARRFGDVLTFFFGLPVADRPAASPAFR